MPYIGNTIRAADDYRLIDDISSGFNGNDTTFALQVAGSAPVPFPKSPQQVLISVNGVIQEPDPTGNSGFNLVGTNIVFSSAPTNGHAFFGIIYATADYLNAGGNFPAGSLGAPSITFIGDENTGLFRKSGGSVGFVSDATEIANFDSNGITISSGNIIIPDSIIHNGDADTKIRFSAANTVSVETGGQTRAVIDGTGLEVTGSVHCTSDLRMGEKLKHLSDQDTFMSFPQNDEIGFTTNNNTRMTITSSGNVGIGTTTPAINLTVVGSNEEDLFQLSTGNTPGNTFAGIRGDNEAGIRIRGGGSERGGEIELAGGARNSDPAVIKFSTNTSNSFQERMRIDSSGRVGIGTSSPSAALEVINSSTGRSYTVSSATEFVVERNGNSQISIIAANNSDSILHFSDTDDENVGLIGYDHANNSMSFRTNASDRVRIDSTGRISAGKDGLGSHNDASEYFKVQSNDTSANISIVGSNDTHSTLNMGDEDDFNIQKIKSDHTDNSLQFFTNDTERMRIDSSGRILIAKGTANTTTSQFAIGTAAGGYSWDVGDVPQVLIAGINNEAPTNGGSLNIAFRIQDENSNIMFQVNNGGGGDSDLGTVGIGTGTPDRQLHIEGNGTAIIRLTDNDTTGEVGSIIGMLEFETRDSNNAGVAANIRSELSDTTNGACKLAFSTGTPSTIGTRMELNSSGALTIAAQPCTVVTNISSGTNLDDNQNGVPLTFQSTHINQGGMALANTRSRITVPFTGTYLVTLCASGGLTTAEAGDGIILRLRRNGANYPTDDSHPAETFGSASGQEWSFTWALPVNLSANDYIEVSLDNIGSTVVYNQSRGYFSATLMH